MPNTECLHNQHGHDNHSDYLIYKNNAAPHQSVHLAFCCLIVVGYDKASPDISDRDKPKAKKMHYNSILLEEVRLGFLTASGL